MKKIYNTIFALALAGVAVAQQGIGNFENIRLPQPEKLVPVTKTIKRPSSGIASQSATSTFWIDYFTDELNQEGLANQGGLGPGYRYFLWPFNEAYDGTNGSSERNAFGTSVYKHFIVAFDSIYDTENQIGYNVNQVSSVRIDSIGFWISHENNSSTSNVFGISVVELATNQFVDYFPSATTYTTTTHTTSTGINPGNDWSDPNAPYFVGLSLNYDLPNGVKRFGVKLTYTASKTDSCALLVGFTDETGDGVNCSYKPLESRFSRLHTAPRNGSTYVWNDYIAKTYAVNTVLPTPTVGNTYTECDGVGVGGNSTAGDGKSMIQNAAILAKVTITTLGMKDDLNNKGVYVYQNVPNPFNGTSVINYRLAESNNVTLEVFDLAGKRVVALAEGKKSSGSHSITLNSSDLGAGVYFYTLTAGNSSVTKKMIIAE